MLLSSVSSDAHTWNLVFLQLLLEENGYDVVNLGACVPDELLLAEARAHAPDVIVISSVNGHGRADGRRLIGALRADPMLRGVPAVIGGKLGVAGADDAADAELLDAGFAAVFPDSPDTGPFLHLVDTVCTARRAARAAVPVARTGHGVIPSRFGNGLLPAYAADAS
ncbi:cobalamin B12-binding domain-containing protein [Motilibacter deserti]|uniref:cobalamin B12-binding domain-containing protein n=1 Tax=Motilibacter deserti TaxID=2714956 RepID=UPI002F2B5BCC